MTGIVQTAAEIGTAVGTVAVAVLAIWGDHIRAWIDPPRLILEPGSLGIPVPLENGITARYYLIKVHNRFRARPAHEVRPMLTRLEEWHNGAFSPLFTERLFLTWDRQEVLGPELTIGADAFFSLFYIRSDGLLVFTPSRSLKHFPAEHRSGMYQAIVEAISEERNSKKYRFTIHWSGEWHEGDTEINNDCRVQVEPIP